MIRWLLLLHRYLGIGLGLIMVMWCLSGVVMMYVSYPAMTKDARIKALAPISWEGCCRLPENVLSDQRPLPSAEIEMLAGRPALYLEHQSQPIDLLSGSEIRAVSSAQAAQVAREFLRTAASGGEPRLLGLVDHDQWTVSGEFRALRPLYRFDLRDSAGTQIYISSVSGRAVQITTASERFWNWLGAVPHWLYFSELRRNTALWNQVVIYTALLGCFLTIIGMYLGLSRTLAQPRGSWSPYAGFNLWHHIAGLVFGVFALSWVASGLLSMNPFGLLEGKDDETERARMHGSHISTADLTGALQALAATRPAAVTVESAVLNDRIFFVARPAAGEPRRLDAAGSPTPLSGEELNFIAEATDGPHPASTPELLRHEDEFYFSHHREIATLPIYRLIAANGTRYYFDATSGMPVAKRDAQAQAYRWLHEGLHRMDFAAFLRGRPQWDILMLTLMTGLTAICTTGAYLGLRRLTR